ncbi:MAG: hypothetical protein ACRD92_08310 [Nitrosopumilaceae archaeon]
MKLQLDDRNDHKGCEYAKIMTRSGLEGTCDVRIATKDYLVSEK